MTPRRSRTPAQAPPAPRSQPGRADLIRWAAAFDAGRLARLAATIGYHKPAPGAAPASSPPTGAEPSGAAPTPAPSRQTDTPAAPVQTHFAVVARRPNADPPPADPPPAAGPPPEPPASPLPPPPPLLPWARLWPFLHAALGDLAERNRVDLPRLVAACGRLRPPRRLPRLRGQRWAPRGQLLLDLSPRLYPFGADLHALHLALTRLRGSVGLAVLALEQGPEGPAQAWNGHDWGPPRRYAPPPADVPVLIAGDLGCLGSAADRAAWVRLGQQFAAGRRAGAHLPAVLTPCPPRWWDPALAGLYFPVFLDRAAHVPPQPRGPRPWPAQPPDPARGLRADPGADHLLTLLAPCVGISPALLRHLRLRLPTSPGGTPIDTGSEAAAWQHPAWVAGDFELLPGDPAALARLRDAWADTAGPAERQLAWALIRAQQAQGITRSRCLEERSLYAALNGQADADDQAFLAEIDRAIDLAEQTGDPARRAWLRGLVNRRAARTHPAAWRHSPRARALWLKANPEALATGAELPQGLRLADALAAGPSPPVPQTWRVWQRGPWLAITPADAADADLRTGSPLIERLHTRWPAMDVAPAGASGAAFSLPLGSGTTLPLTSPGWLLRTEQEEVTIAPVPRRDWALAMGRDGDGLFVDFADDDGAGGAPVAPSAPAGVLAPGQRRAYWCAPLDWLAWPGAPAAVQRAERTPWDEHGCFIDADQWRLLKTHGMVPWPGLGSLTWDRFGARWVIPIKGIDLALRWLWPGEFLMGSPPDEAERYEDERQHRVILTRGLWLAETACTQALWQAMMGQNPSNELGAERPVESVSWENAQGLVERLNEALAGLLATTPGQSGPGDWLSPTKSFFARLGVGEPSATADDAEPSPAAAALPRFRLPTEAEWEYACRAGTDTAYAFGDRFDPALANNGSATVPVRSLPSNQWGFYEMHGNVWEWCLDWFGGYTDGPVFDPAGPPAGGRRVLRGGSWILGARILRSAYRNDSDPGYRLGAYGLRLALGPELGPAGAGGDGATARGASGRLRTAPR